MRIAVVLESPHPLPSARAFALARALAGADGPLCLACSVDPTTDGGAVAASLGIGESALVADAALARAASRGRAQALAALMSRLAIDAAFIDAAADGGGGLFSAALAHFRGAHGLYRCSDVTADPAGGGLLVDMTLAGKRRRFRVPAPAVLSVVGTESAAPAPPPPARVQVTRFSLADLGLDPAKLAGDPVPGATFAPATSRKPLVITDIGELL